jgi:hypothetical protein
MLSPETLDALFPDRREILARDGGCASHLAEHFIPAGCLGALTDAQIDALTPRWKVAVKTILAAVPTDLLETEEAQAS